jgi:L-ribulose-5-phosphate 4-epimerase
MYQELRDRVCSLNRMLPEENLVVWTGGNVSAIVRETGHVVIKPSGVLFADLTPESMVVIDMKGDVVEGDFKPSVDSSIHLYLYEKRSDVSGICHTHSPYATSFALLGEGIPAGLTPLTHLLGRDVPCTEYARAGYVDTGEAIMETLPDGYGVLVRRHGVFTFGKSPEFSVKVAAHIEEAARTVHYAMLRGKVTPLSEDEQKRCFEFYENSYGQ